MYLVLVDLPTDPGLGLLHGEIGSCHTEDSHYPGSHAGGE